LQDFQIAAPQPQPPKVAMMSPTSGVPKPTASRSSLTNAEVAQ